MQMVVLIIKRLTIALWNYWRILWGYVGGH